MAVNNNTFNAHKLYVMLLCYVIYCYVMYCYVMYCYVMLCIVILCIVMLCIVMLCIVILCIVMLCIVLLSYVKYEMLWFGHIQKSSKGLKGTPLHCNAFPRSTDKLQVLKEVSNRSRTYQVPQDRF